MLVRLILIFNCRHEINYAPFQKTCCKDKKNTVAQYIAAFCSFSGFYAAFLSGHCGKSF